jgi:thioredoxin reductase (NADPH)
VVAIGSMGKPNKPDYKIPPKLKSVVNFNTDKCSTNENILVVGGGNSASEYAYALVDDGN